jgi:hypothetical protein
MCLEVARTCSTSQVLTRPLPNGKVTGYSCSPLPLMLACENTHQYHDVNATACTHSARAQVWAYANAHTDTWTSPGLVTRPPTLTRAKPCVQYTHENMIIPTLPPHRTPALTGQGQNSGHSDRGLTDSGGCGISTDLQFSTKSITTKMELYSCKKYSLSSLSSF